MLEQLLHLERHLFLAINNFHTAFLDNALWLYTGMAVWIPFILFFLAILIYHKPVRDWLPVVVALVAVVLIGHLVVAGIFKPHFARFRPIFHPDFMNDVLSRENYTGGGLYGFISGHSTFAFGIAMFTSLLFRYRPYTVVIFIWALIMVYSRLYFGVHFISDVAAGMIVGVLIGIGVYYLYMLYINRMLSKQQGITPKWEGIYSPYRKKLLTYTLVGYITLFMVFSEQIVGW